MSVSFLIRCSSGLLLVSATAWARPTIRTSFFNEYPSAVGSAVETVPSAPSHCGVCHYRFGGNGPRNPYGAALEAVLPNYPNNDNGRRQAMRSIETADSDGDLFSTLVEVTDTGNFANTPTFPGLIATNVSNVTEVDLNDILGHLTPAGADQQAPAVTVLSPNGGENLTGTDPFNVTWNATDNVGIATLDIFYRDSETNPWTQIARGLDNGGSWVWPVHLTPATQVRVQVVARGAAGNIGSDSSNQVFTISHPGSGIVPTTLRDFHQPGTQPFGAGNFSDRAVCAGCHGGFAPATEPDWNFQGSMMAQAARDPLFLACLDVAEQDAPGAGDLCLRCHTPGGWLSGRSNPTDGSALTAVDRDGVGCDPCHRIVDPLYQPGVSPAEDQALLAALPPGDAPPGYAGGMFVEDPQNRRRGPFNDTVAPHAVLASPFHRSSDLCGTCHDVSNPAFTRAGDLDYVPGPLDAQATSFDSATLFPLERTYSEWKNSTFNSPAGVYLPDFAGNKPGGFVSACQDCHMRDVIGKGCTASNAPIRQDLPLHDLQGGNTWMPGIIGQLWGEEVDPAALAEGALRAQAMLELAADLDVALAGSGGSLEAVVTVTNRTGHKLPSGYPEGRRIWLEVTARDGGGVTVYQSGVYVTATGELIHDPDLTVYEAKLGVSPALAGVLGIGGGPSFHFALNDTIVKDNRIPPLGFTNAAFSAFGGRPVDPEQPGERYPDGQNWDVATYPLPSAATELTVRLLYQTTSKEYVEFLRDANVTTARGDEMCDLWVANGRAAPVVMEERTVPVIATDVDGAPPQYLAVSVSRNPARRPVTLTLTLPQSERVQLEIFDASGRRAHRAESAPLPAGVHTFSWNGADPSGQAVPAGAYFLRLRAGKQTLNGRFILLP
ncbi:MAG: T9SS type A sorting domain-containing protein [Candidatus Eisenbacteria bacterium]|nr:T9SS type A sorting domain-containing protein [Candidatus Eisenbacteria bacterium]